jgi:hypothetical protein
MDTCQTVKVAPWGNGQGAFVEVNVTDFKPGLHVPLDEAEAAKVAHLMQTSIAPPSTPGGDNGHPSDGLTVAELKDALAAKGIAFEPTAKKADLQALLDEAGD